MSTPTRDAQDDAKSATEIQRTDDHGARDGTEHQRSKRSKPWLWDDFGIRFRWRAAIAAVAAVAVIAIGSSANSHGQYVITSVLMWALVASCLNLVFGLAGQLALGQGAFLTLGAYIGVLGTGRFGWNGWLSLAVAGLAAGVLTWLLGAVIFRARGLYFALLTTGLALVAYEVAGVWTPVTGGTAGISTSGPIELGGAAKPLTLEPITIEEPLDYLALGAVLLASLCVAVSVIRRRKTGASWRAIREDEVLAASVGIAVAREKRIAFVAASVTVAMVGVIFGHWLGYILPENFTFAGASFGPLAMVVIGGSGTVVGPIIGAMVVAGMPEIFRDLQELSTFAYGAILLLVMLVMPAGVMGLLRTVTNRVTGRSRRNPQEEE
ncbi:branched-chain amino acid ABC transporter permease [Cumulibacter manganitolerans]|uniref:branched-chain amino acid ABC transporter permease n=1 Tax=Cumulibacter manganitolerans TaxID=1884992 RepID=UPI001297DFE8|nr:branched-chain amino acid ABC transporter permease [Cumulibacter manganitolerans]